MSNILIQRKFPEDYSDDVVDIINTMSFNNGYGTKIVGSMSLRSQLYASDYDCIQNVESTTKNLNRFVDQLKKSFQQIIKNLLNKKLCYIGDIKCGIVPEWQVIDDYGYNYFDSFNKLTNLLEINVIDKKEYNEKLKLLKHQMSYDDLLLIKSDFKYHIVRWTPKEILKGYKELADGSIYDLKEGFNTEGITKLDVIAWVDGNRFTDFSILYEFKINGECLNCSDIDIRKTIKEDVLLLYKEGNYFKMAKRIFSLSRLDDDKKSLELLSPLFNEDLGILYQVFGDITTLKYLFENQDHLPYERILFEIDHFKNRLAKIVIPSYMNKNHNILSIINHLETLDLKETSEIILDLNKLENIINNILKKESEKYLKSINFLPVPSIFLP